MNGKHTAMVLIASGSLLAACGGNDERSTATDNYVLENAAPYGAFTLTPEQRQRRDAVNMQAYESEYRGYVDDGAGMAPAGSTPSPRATETVVAPDMEAGNTGDAMSNSAGMVGPGGSSTANGGPIGDDFASLDRNHDGKLSVAEYAIWAVNLDPGSRAGKPNDQKRPYASADQLNRAADSFFHFDANGDTYLQPDELRRAQAELRR